MPMTLPLCPPEAVPIGNSCFAVLIERLRAALGEGRDEDAAAIRQNLDEILFYLE